MEFGSVQHVRDIGTKVILQIQFVIHVLLTIVTHADGTLPIAHMNVLHVA